MNFFYISKLTLDRFHIDKLILLIFLAIFYIYIFTLYHIFNININIYNKYNNDQLFKKECYVFINGEQAKQNTSDCFVHSYYRQYLSCHLGVPPSQAQIGRVLVLGSAGKIGLSLTKSLKKSQIPFLEIRGRYQFDLNNSQIYEIFDTLNITHVYDLVRHQEGEILHNKINDYFLRKNIIVTRFVDREIDSKFDQIISSYEPFGNQYMKLNVSRIFNHTFYCIVENKCKYFSFSEKKKFITSTEISIELLKALSQKVPKIKRIVFKAYSEKQIWNKVLKFKRDRLDKNDIFYSIFNDIYKDSIDRKVNPFLSIGYLTTNDEKHYSNAANTLKMYQKVLDQYPDISVEITLFWVMLFNTTKFEDCIRIDKHLRFRLHVIDVSKKDMQTVLDVLHTTFIPEYFFRDISTKLGNGELLMTGSSDAYPSPSLFEIAQRKLVGPFTILKSDRIRAPEFNESFYYYLEKQDTVTSALDHAKEPCDFHHYLLSSLGHLGDVQGTVRSTMKELNGWIFGKYCYAVDAAFVWDMMMFKVPFYIVQMPNSMHKHHKFVSYKTPRFKLSHKVRASMFLCNGIPTKYINGYLRNNWGVSYDFQTSKHDKNRGKFGHLLYDLVQMNDQKLKNYRKSKIVFKIVYNNDIDNYNTSVI